MTRCDVLVVGGGPAGSCAAWAAAGAGASTILVERKKRYGVPVQCGEYFPTLATSMQMMPRATGLPELMGLVEDHCARASPTLDILSPRGRRYSLPFSGMGIFRDRFEAALAARAHDVGAQTHTGVTVRRIEGLLGGGPVEVETNRLGTISANVVIGADGPQSLVRRTLGLPDPQILAPCAQFGFAGEFSDATELYFGEVAPGGYAWVIPKCDGANIGVGVQPQFSRMPLRKVLEHFLRRLGLQDTTPIYGNGGWVPCSGPIHSTAKGRALLAGDAAGMVMASNGGGMLTAMLAGREAGRTAADHLHHGIALSTYEVRWKEQMGDLLHHSLVTKQLADRFFGNDRILELIMRLMGPRAMLRAVSCKRLYPFLP